MSDDMTFCMDQCNHKVCFRHPSHIRVPQIPHSYAHFKGTDECIIYGDVKPLKVGDYHARTKDVRKKHNAK